MDNKVFTAKLGKTVGLAGLVKVHIESDFPEQFKTGNSFVTNKKTTLKVESFNPKNSTIKFEGINNIDDAKKLVNQELFSSIQQTRETCNLGKKEFFWFDIMKCKIVDDGKLLGVVKDIHRYPISDYLEIDTAVLLIEQELPKNFLVPYTDQYIIKVDLENKIIETRDCLAILQNS